MILHHLMAFHMRFIIMECFITITWDDDWTSMSFFKKQNESQRLNVSMRWMSTCLEIATCNVG